MDAKELQPKNAHELERLAAELREQLRQERFKVSTRQKGTVHSIKALRKDLARIATALGAKSRTSTPTNV